MLLGRARWPGALASRGVTHRPPPGALATRPTALLGTCWTDRSSADAEAGPLAPLCQEPTRVHSERSKTLRSNAFQGGHSE